MPAPKIEDAAVDVTHVDAAGNNEQSGVLRPFPISGRLTRGGNGGGHSSVTCVMKDRIEALEENDTIILKELSGVKMTLGEPPDPIKGTPGSGMSALLFRIANAVVKDRQKMHSYPELEEITGEHFAPGTQPLEFDEGENTKIQDRQTLLVRAKLAEAERAAAEKALATYKEARGDAKKEMEVASAHFVEVNKTKIEKWKIVLAAMGVLLGPGVINLLATHVPALINTLVGR